MASFQKLLENCLLSANFKTIYLGFGVWTKPTHTTITHLFKLYFWHSLPRQYIKSLKRFPCQVICVTSGTQNLQGQSWQKKYAKLRRAKWCGRKKIVEQRSAKNILQTTLRSKDIKMNLIHFQCLKLWHAYPFTRNNVNHIIKFKLNVNWCLIPKYFVVLCFTMELEIQFDKLFVLVFLASQN
jgi:hypothetical protein